MTNEEALRVVIQGVDNSIKVLRKKENIYHHQFIRQWTDVGWRLNVLLKDPVIVQRMKEIDEELREKASLRYNNALRNSMEKA